VLVKCGYNLMYYISDPKLRRKIMTKVVKYPAIFDDTQNDPGVYSVNFPDVPDALTYGYTLDQAINRAPGALGISLYGNSDSEIPTPSDLNDVQKANPQAIVNMVSVDLDDLDVEEIN